MFSSQAVKSLSDLSFDISEPTDWRVSLLRTIQYHLDITAVATEPTSGLLAVGTSRGTVHLYGDPGVECELRITDPTGLRVRFLQFATSAFKLLCVDKSPYPMKDEHDRLHVWDLAGSEKPRLQRITGFGQTVNAIVTSPSHTHAFVALAGGVIKTYDLLCLRISQYVIPNLWSIYEEKSLASGLSSTDALSPGTILDMLIHPRDLNLLFVAYEGGVILCDLKEQFPVRTFELILSPGAPGGTGYHLKDILLPRRVAVTAMAIHPTGHMLAIGYSDGTIGFWAIEDEDKCLLLRTIDSPDDEDLSLVDTEKLEAVMSNPQQHAPDTPREPIFKLAWSGFSNSSDPRGGDTALTVLGGSTIDSSPGITVQLLPPLQPPAPPAPTSPKGNVPTLHLQTRAAMCASLAVKDTYSYSTAGPVQDFLLFPRASPHFSGSFDPTAVLVISDSDVPEARISEAFTFPPPCFISSAEVPPAVSDPASPKPNQDEADEAFGLDDSLVNELGETLQAMSVSEEPMPITLPPCLWNVLGEQVVKIDKHAHETLVRDKLDPVDGEASFPVKGGVAWQDDEEGLMKYTKQQPQKVLVTILRDLTVRFLDISPQLLNSTSLDTPLGTSFPSPLPHLTIDLAPLLIDRSLGLIVHGDKYDARITRERVDNVHFAPESLECAVVFRSQAVVLYRLDVPGDTQPFVQPQLEDAELVSLAHLRSRKGRRYSPVLAVKPDRDRGLLCSYALSDIGFLAVSYASGALLIIDLRGPKVILRNDTQTHGGAGFLHRHAEVDPFQSLAWTCCGVATDPTFRLRLIATAASGHATIFTLQNATSSEWAVSQPVTVTEGSARPLTSGSFILDAKTGNRCPADRQSLAAILQGTTKVEESKKCIWVSAGAKGVRTTLDVNGERIAKVDWGSKVGIVQHVEIAGKLDSQALIAYTSLGLALVYSLPHLEHIHTMQLSASGMVDPPSTDSTGDYTTHLTFPVPSGAPFRPLMSIELHTLFPTKLASTYAPPHVDLTRGRAPIPPQPQPVSLGPPSMMSSMLGYIGSLAATSAGDQIDALLAGPDRPLPVTLPDRPSTRPTAGGSSADGNTQNELSARAADMSSGVGNLYNRLGTALQERGEMLGDLQQTLNNLEEGSKSMVAQAKSLAAQQGVKRWFGF